jgi:hypothetical protein
MATRDDPLTKIAELPLTAAACGRARFARSRGNRPRTFREDRMI